MLSKTIICKYIISLQRYHLSLLVKCLTNCGWVWDSKIEMQWQVLQIETKTENQLYLNCFEILAQFIWNYKRKFWQILVDGCVDCRQHSALFKRYIEEKYYFQSFVSWFYRMLTEDFSTSIIIQEKRHGFDQGLHSKFFPIFSFMPACAIVVIAPFHIFSLFWDWQEKTSAIFIEIYLWAKDLNIYFKNRKIHFFLA